MYTPGDFFSGGGSRPYAGRPLVILHDKVQLLTHLDQRQRIYANPGNRPNGLLEKPVQHSFEEWWESDDELEDSSEKHQQQSEVFDAPINGRKRPASCHWTPNPPSTDTATFYKKRHKSHATHCTRPDDAPMKEMRMSSPQITALKNEMYTFHRYNTRNTRLGLHLSFRDEPMYDEATITIAGLEVKPAKISGIKAASSRWFEMFWGLYDEDYVYDMEEFENKLPNHPMNIIRSYSYDELDNTMIAGMYQNGPFLFDEHVSKLLYPTRKQANETYHHEQIHRVEDQVDVHSTDKRLKYARVNTNYTFYMRHILQTLFHIAFNKRDWETSAKIYGTLAQNKGTNGLFTLPFGLEVLRNINYRKFVNKLKTVKQVGDTCQTDLGVDMEMFNSLDAVMSIDANTLHAISELRNPVILPLILSNNESTAFTSTLKEIEELIKSPSPDILRIDKLLKHFSRSERTTEIQHLNGPESAFMLPIYNDDQGYSNELSEEMEAEFQKLNDNPEYNLRKPSTVPRHTVHNRDKHSHYRLGNSKKFSPSLFGYVQFLIMNGKFDQAKDSVLQGQKNKISTSEAGVLLIEVNIGQILGKLSEIMSVTEYDPLRKESLIKEIEGLHSETLDLWAKWKDEFGFTERNSDDDDYGEFSILKKRRLEGMDNWNTIEESIIRLGVWIEFVKHGGKVGLGVEVFGADFTDNGLEDVREEDEDEGAEGAYSAGEDIDESNGESDLDLSEEEIPLNESEEEDMNIHGDEFDERNPQFQLEMDNLMARSQSEQLPLEQVEEDNDDEFNSDNSDYQREMAKYSQYSQQVATHDSSSLDELSD